MLMADEVDRLAGVVNRLVRRAVRHVYSQSGRLNQSSVKGFGNAQSSGISIPRCVNVMRLSQSST